MDIYETKSRCCGRCDGIDDICVTDTICEPHKVKGCEQCFGPIEVKSLIPPKELTVQQFSIIPVQSGVMVETPDGKGTYEGITSSGIVTVCINGGMKIYSWNEVKPDLTLKLMLDIDELKSHLIEYIFRDKVLPRALVKKI